MMVSDVSRDHCGCITAQYLAVHVGFVVRTRVMCQAGRARAADVHGDIVAWLCERAPHTKMLPSELDTWTKFLPNL